MTAACMRLLYEAECPIWPWSQANQTGLLVEAFPAAQLCHWEMNHERYGKEKDSECITNRKKVVNTISTFIEISDRHRASMERSADALDAVTCAFAAMAVSTGQLSQSASEIAVAREEGQIAVHDKFPWAVC